MKYYAVKQGRKPGIYTSWPECQKQVQGFSNAIFKSFATLQEAKVFLGQSQSVPQSRKTDNDSIDRVVASLKEEEAAAFVDGSYLHPKRVCGYGVLVLPEMITFQQSFRNPEITQSRNFSAEMLGALEAVEWAVRNHRKVLYLYYDYAGIEAFADHSWSPKNEIAKEYVKRIDELSKQIRIRFIKVQSHTGVLYNDIADQLAKDSLKLPSGEVHTSFWKGSL